MSSLVVRHRLPDGRMVTDYIFLFGGVMGPEDTMMNLLAKLKANRERNLKTLADLNAQIERIELIIHGDRQPSLPLGAAGKKAQ